MKSMVCSSRRYGLSSSIFAFCIFLMLSGCSAIQQFQSGIIPSSSYFRVESFPSGDEIAALGGSWFAGNVIENTYPYSFEKVWNATYRTVQLLVELSKKNINGTMVSFRPIVSKSKEDAYIQVGKIVDPGEIGRLNGIGITKKGLNWADEFHIKLKELSEDSILVSIERKVAVGVPKKVDNIGTSFKDEVKYQATTGDYERWILTRLDDDLNGTVKRSSIAILQLQSTDIPTYQFNINLDAIKSNYSYKIGFTEPTYNISGIENLKKLTSQEISFIKIMISSFKDSLNSAIPVLLNSLGYEDVIKFSSISQLTYPQKQAYPLVLKSELYLNISESYGANYLQKGEIKESAIQDTIYPSIVNGNLNTGAKLIIKLIEPFSQEMMWSSTVEIDETSENFSYKFTLPGEDYFGGKIDEKTLVHGEDNRPEILSNFFSSSFSKIVEETYSKLNPDLQVEIFKQTNNLRVKRKY